MLYTININYLLYDKLSEIIRLEELKSNYCDSSPIFLNFEASKKIARRRFPVDFPASVWLKLNEHENIWVDPTWVCVWILTSSLNYPNRAINHLAENPIDFSIYLIMWDVSNLEMYPYVELTSDWTTGRLSSNIEA